MTHSRPEIFKRVEVQANSNHSWSFKFVSYLNFDSKKDGSGWCQIVFQIAALLLWKLIPETQTTLDQITIVYKYFDFHRHKMWLEKYFAPKIYLICPFSVLKSLSNGHWNFIEMNKICFFLHDVKKNSRYLNLLFSLTSV